MPRSCDGCAKKKKAALVSIFIHNSCCGSQRGPFEGMTAHKEQLQIELTEHPVKGQHDSFDLSTALAKIKAYGYVIVVDDIGCGQNTLSLVYSNLENVDCLKFSLLPFIQLDEEIGFSFLTCWLSPKVSA